MARQRLEQRAPILRSCKSKDKHDLWHLHTPETPGDEDGTGLAIQVGASETEVDVRQEGGLVRRSFAIKTIGVFALTLACLALPSKAMAVPITGSIGFAGSIQPVADWSTVNAFDIAGNQALVVCNVFALCTGTFGAFNDIDIEVATYNDFTLAGGVSPLWSLEGFNFNLVSITSVIRSPSGIVLTGTGTLTGPAGFDPTGAQWSFSADETEVFRFSSTTAAAVPDAGSTLTLLGAAFLGLAAARRRFGV